MPGYDLIINNGRYFDGSNSPSARRNVAVRDGKIALVSESPISETGCPEVIDAEGQWVMPGFLDTHTHYDAEVIVAPSLSESVRHGVTTVLMGSCSLSMVCSDPEDCSDLFTRVESVPREQVLPILKKHKSWRSPAEWVEFLKTHPLGPNVISFLGHSDLRASVLGFSESVDPDYVPTDNELEQMGKVLKEALDNGFLGLSTMSLKWDKLDGDREWSKSLPSTYSRWKEVRFFNRILRKRGRIHQGAPNVMSPLTVTKFLQQCIGGIRKPLKTTLIALIDLRGNRAFSHVSKLASTLTGLFGGDFRWQVLPTPFAVYADGIDLVVFEEFGAGEAALHLKDQVERNKLLQDESYRREFRRFYQEKYSPRVWQRDFGDAYILDCPDQELVGKNFDELARERNVHVVDLFLDLVVKFGRSMRWHTVIGNDREDYLNELISYKHALISFSDAGAHIRNMSFYNFPLRMLKKVHQAEQNGKPIMSLEQAVWRLTGEQGDWFGVDAGHIREGDRADITIVDPKGLDQDLEQAEWAEMEGFNGTMRLVNRNEDLVRAVYINGKRAYDGKQVDPQLGHSQGYGSFLPAL